MGDLEFRLYPEGIEVIKTYIEKDLVALAKCNWPACIRSFVSKASTRLKLLNEFEDNLHAQSIINTLEGWLEEQDDKATFGKLIQILETRDLNYLSGQLKENVEMIKSAQCAIGAVVKLGRRRNYWFGMSDPISNFVGRAGDLKKLHELVTERRDDENSSEDLLASLSGFPGTGKTALCGEYAWQYRNHFDGNVILIDAEKFDSMQKAFETLAEKFELGKAKQNPGLKDLIELVYNAFAGSKCLFIFENFNGEDSMKECLPDGIVLKPYLLRTSVRNDCFNRKRLHKMDELSKSESTELVKKYIKGTTDKIAERLAETVGRFPLPLHQAIAYINESSPEHSGALNRIDSFIKKYESSSNLVFTSKFVGGGGYAKNVISICELSLLRIEREKFGKLAKHMLRYISFLHPDHIQLDFLLKLDYRFESIWEKLQRIIPWTDGNPTDPNMTIGLLHSFSLIHINEDRTIKVYKFFQDATRFTLTHKEELLYVKRLLTCLAKDEYSENLSHWKSIYRSCRFEASKRFVQAAMPQSIELLGPLVPSGFNTDFSKKLQEILSRYWILPNLLTSILAGMKY